MNKEKQIPLATMNSSDVFNIMQNTIDMIMDAFERPTSANSEDLEAFIKGSQLSEEQWSYIISKAEPYHVFVDQGMYLMKTPDNKIECVGDYLRRRDGALVRWRKQAKRLEKELEDYRNPTFFGTLKQAIYILFGRKKHD